MALSQTERDAYDYFRQRGKVILPGQPTAPVTEPTIQIEMFTQEEMRPPYSWDKAYADAINETMRETFGE
jgi:hypothetical protein